MQQLRSTAFSLLALGLLGCNPGEFQEYLDTAPIRAHGAPDKFQQSNYGRVMTAFGGSLDGKPAGRIVASAGGGTPIVFTRQYDDGKVGDKAFLRCRDGKECTDAGDIGAAMIPFEVWGTGTEDPRQMCVFAPSNGTRPLDSKDPRLGGVGFVVCEAPSNKPHSFNMGTAITDTRGSDESSLLFSGFGLPPKHPLGVVVFGAYAIDNRTSTPKNGGLFVQGDLRFVAEDNANSAPWAERVPLVDPETDEPFHEAADAADFGRQVAGALDGDRVVIAIAQPSKQRVIVASYDDALSGMPIERFRVHACIESPDASLRGFGERVVVGDLTGDGAPEIVIGIDPVGGAEAGKQALFVYDGRGLPAAVTGDRCPPWNQDGSEVTCRDGDGLDCEGSGFGASLALGDVDADGKGDLIVGAPTTRVGGKAEVGAVWLIPGASDGLDLERSTVITVPSAEKARFGWAVAALPTKGRVEPVASALGVSEVYTLMCTPIEDGFGGKDLCLD